MSELVKSCQYLLSLPEATSGARRTRYNFSSRPSGASWPRFTRGCQPGTQVAANQGGMATLNGPADSAGGQSPHVRSGASAGRRAARQADHQAVNYQKPGPVPPLAERALASARGRPAHVRAREGYGGLKRSRSGPLRQHGAHAPRRKTLNPIASVVPAVGPQALVAQGSSAPSYSSYSPTEIDRYLMVRHTPTPPIQMTHYRAGE
jgi:hypothetical protein